MFNVGGPEVLVILLVALIVLGPQQLPKAVRSVGNVMAELRRMSSGFQDEIRNAIDAPIEADARERGSRLARTPEEADITETVARNDAPLDASVDDNVLDSNNLDHTAVDQNAALDGTALEADEPGANGRSGSSRLDPDSVGGPAAERPSIVTNPSDRAAG